MALPNFDLVPINQLPSVVRGRLATLNELYFHLGRRAEAVFTDEQGRACREYIIDAADHSLDEAVRAGG